MRIDHIPPLALGLVVGNFGLTWDTLGLALSLWIPMLVSVKRIARNGGLCKQSNANQLKTKGFALTSSAIMDLINMYFDSSMIIIY